MKRQGKIWGETTEFFRNALVSAHHIFVRKGGYCSKHRHQHKYNLFYVIRGRLLVQIWRDEQTVDETIVGPGQATAVSPDFYHRFWAIEETEAIEVYQVFLEDPDIERATEGGIKEIHG